MRRTLAATASVAASLLTPVATSAAPLPVHDGARNLGFEAPLDAATNWTAERRQGSGYPNRGPNPGAYPGGGPLPELCPTAAADARRGICAVGADTFTATEGGTYPGALPPRTWTQTVTPREGATMLRLGGPYTSPSQLQPWERYEVRQQFVVRTDQTVLEVNTNSFGWDYSGSDSVVVELRADTRAGEVLYRSSRSLDTPGVTLRSTGWVNHRIGLAGLEGRSVVLSVSSGGIYEAGSFAYGDASYGFWTYVDAGLAEQGRVGRPVFTPPTVTPSGEPVAFTTFDRPDGAVAVSLERDQAEQFPWYKPFGGYPGGYSLTASPCLPTRVSVPIGSSVAPVSSVVFHFTTSRSDLYDLWHPDQRVNAVDPEGDGTWTLPTGKTVCLGDGRLRVEYVVGSRGEANARVTDLAVVTLVTPSGRIYDQNMYEVARDAGAEPRRAVEWALIGGATARLQVRDTAGRFRTLLDGGSEFAPSVNAQVVPTSGRRRGTYAWHVSPGTYRVLATAPGYEPNAGPESTVVRSWEAGDRTLNDLFVPLRPMCPAGTAPVYPTYRADVRSALEGPEKPDCRSGSVSPPPASGASNPPATPASPTRGRILFGSLSRQLRLSLTGRLTVPCSTAAATAAMCVVTVSTASRLRAKSRVVLARARGPVRRGRATVTVRFSAKAISRIRAAGRSGVAVRISAVALDRSGATVADGSRSARLTVRARR